jgi:rod shape determining protein RodA
MLSLSRRYFSHFDWINFGIICALSLCGLLFVFSATYTPAQPFSLFFKKQLLGMLSGMLLFFGVCHLDPRALLRWGYFAYFVTLALLVFTILKGSIGMGAQRWINLGIIKFQPSELAKLFFPPYVTYYFYTQRRQQYWYFADFIPLLCMLGVSALLIVKQPDLDFALLLIAQGLIMFWLLGIGRTFFITCTFLVVCCAPVIWYGALKEYQKKRVLVFFGQGSTHKERYQIEQSKIAIGSGGLCGKGYMQGTQNQLQFLPERRTDFIFSIIAEELGFFGTITLLCLFTVLYLRLFISIALIKDPYCQLLALGLLSHLLLSTYINIGMVIGVVPVVGIPLPLISYGLSNLWITFITLGWITTIIMHRQHRGDKST